MPFNRTSGVPNLDSRLCFNESSSTSEEVFVEVRAAARTAIQLGGVGNAAGSLEFLFDFLADLTPTGCSTTRTAAAPWRAAARTGVHRA